MSLNPEPSLHCHPTCNSSAAALTSEASSARVCNPLLLMPARHPLTNFRGKDPRRQTDPRGRDEKTRSAWKRGISVHAPTPAHTAAASTDVPGMNAPNPGGHPHSHPCSTAGKTEAQQDRRRDSDPHEEPAMPRDEGPGTWAQSTRPPPPSLTTSQQQPRLVLTSCLVVSETHPNPLRKLLLLVPFYTSGKELWWWIQS